MYTAEISRGNPTAFLFLIDQSGSMVDRWGGGAKSKAQEVADAINNLLYTLVMRCSKGEEVLDWFHVGVFGYGAAVGPCLDGALKGQELVPISQIAANPLKLEDRARKVPDGAGGLVEAVVKFPVWIRPTANGGTPMCAAFGRLKEVVAKWTADRALSYPPTVIHITDGESTDGDPSAIVEEIKKTGTDDGDTLVFNIHISSKGGNQIRFADTEEGLPDDYARMLFRTASVLPEPLRREAAKEGFAVSEGSRGFAFNADLVQLVQFLDIGTRAANLR
ncbi:MAG TPA: vWA domain-containing protein [Thermodesulfobacteriota bacterium]|nr:vWA domain-containing protein [Thermodesulfobacteriota bacterium]